MRLTQVLNDYRGGMVRGDINSNATQWILTDLMADQSALALVPVQTIVVAVD